MSTIFRHAMKRQISPALRLTRTIHSTPAVSAPRRPNLVNDHITEDEQVNILKKIPVDEDSPSAGHILLDHYRELVYYMRLIEHDMPRLVAFRKEFVPPTTKTPLIVRSVHYAGEEHPVTVKRVIVAPVRDLPLRNNQARHKIRVLAGVRWTPQPPTDAGVSGTAGWEDGFIKISCERFPEPAMNLKWASDVLDKLVAQANNLNNPLSDVPVDMRHVYAKLHKSKKGHRRGRFSVVAPSIRDFPSEWLPGTEVGGVAAAASATA